MNELKTIAKSLATIAGNIIMKPSLVTKRGRDLEELQFKAKGIGLPDSLGEEFKYVDHLESLKFAIQMYAIGINDEAIQSIIKKAQMYNYVEYLPDVARFYQLSIASGRVYQADLLHLYHRLGSLTNEFTQYLPDGVELIQPKEQREKDPLVALMDASSALPPEPVDMLTKDFVQPKETE